MDFLRQGLLYGSPHIYEALSETRNQIRVLHLRPGQRGDPLSIRLETIDLAVLSDFQYEALSYTWGDPKDTVPVSIVQGDRYTSLSITRNCAHALEHLRWTDQFRTLWIDAICINQGDDVEKGRQVSGMAAIYRNASRVIAWLGRASKTTEIAFDWIREVRSHVAVKMETFELRLLSEDSRWIQPGGSAMISEDEVAALADLLSHSWFERVWIWQEVRAGYGNVKIKCGAFEIRWSALCTAVLYLAGKTTRGPFHGLLNARCDSYVRGMCDMRFRSMFQSLDLMRNCSCTIQSDRVYAVRSMFGPETRAVLGEPDYSKSWQSIYTQVCINYAQTYQRLDFLEFVKDDTPAQGLPTWVPNWTSKIYHRRIMAFAGGYSACALTSIDQRKLVVKGRFIGVVETIFPTGFTETWSDYTVERKTALLAELIQTLRGHRTFDSGDLDLSPLCSVLTIGRFSEASLPQATNLNGYSDYYDALEMLAAQQQVPTRLETAISDISDNCLNRTVLVTSDGKLGLGPWSIRSGDRIAVLLGCSVPMLLRPTANSEYQVLGPAYVQDVMEGQSLLGPLSSEHEFVWCRVQGVKDAGFRNQEDNTIRLTDPRLPELSPDWRYIGNMERPGEKAFENVRTGERRYHREDPRCDAEALEARGIELQMFTLV